eukprot:scaffold1799_cov201-Skeletonema_menzelii.AAC.2
MTTEQHNNNRCAAAFFSTSDDEEGVSGLIRFPPLSPPRTPTFSNDININNNNEGCPSPACFSLSDFSWGENVGDSATVSAAVTVPHKTECNTKNNNDGLIFSNDVSSNNNISLCSQNNVASSWPGGMQPALTVQQNNNYYPSVHTAQLPPTHGHHFAAPDPNKGMSSLQHVNTANTNTETIQLYALLFQAQADYAAMLQQFSTTSNNTPNVEAVNLFSANVAPPFPLNNEAGGGPSSLGFSSGNTKQPQQQVQVDVVQSQMMQGGPQYSHHLKEDDSNPQLHCGLTTTTTGNNNDVVPETISNHPTRLSVPSDEEFLDPVYNFLRMACIEVFLCGNNDSGARGRGANSHCIGQVGLRCVHCKHIERSNRANQAVSYPSKTTNIFESVRNYQRTHFEACEHIPGELKTKYREMMLKSYRKIHAKYLKVYFAEAACEIGMVETPKGLFFGKTANTSGKPSEKLLAIMSIAENPTSSANKQLRDLIFPKVDKLLMNSKFSHVASPSTCQVIANCRQETAVFVYPSDFPTVSDFRFVLYHQFISCRPPDAALNRRKTKPDNWDTLSGLYCKHCAKAHPGERYKRGMYFPLDFESLHDSSFSQNLACHVMTCMYVPVETKEALDELELLAAEHGAITKRGAKKKFLQKVWDRMANYYRAP